MNELEFGMMIGSSMSEFTITLSIKKIAYWLLGIVGVLVVIHLAAHFYQYSTQPSYQLLDIINRVDVGDEISIPTWMAQTLLLISAGLLSLVAALSRHQEDPRWQQWALLGGVFVYASLDEGASLHELLAYLEVPGRLGLSSGYLAFLWVIPGIIIALLLIAFFWKFWWSLPVRTRWLFALSGFLFLSGAIGAEMIGANHYSQHGPDSYVYSGVFAAIEEGLEMVGVVMFIYALLDYLQKQKTAITFHIQS